MKSRIFNSIRNTGYAFLSQGLSSILAFITRTVFINTLGRNYLGINGLFSDILTLLSLAELGVGTAIIYSMYKPFAEKDEKKVAALLNLYGKVYTILGIVVTLIGLSLIPFLSFFISDVSLIPDLKIIYLLYLLNTSFSYFFIYKKSMLIVSQKMYVASKIQMMIITIQSILQIVVLLVFNNIIFYLLVQVVLVLVNNIYISIYVNNKFRYLKVYKSERVDSKTKSEIFKNISAMFLSKLSSVIVTSTDNILISKYVSTVVLGYYSNYTLFVMFIRQIFSKLFDSITGSVGNLVAIESKEKAKEVFENILFVSFWLVGLFSIMFFILINPFIDIWIGSEYLLSRDIVFWICLNLYMRFIRNPSLTYIDTYGLFNKMKWKCVLEAIINFTSSLFYLKVLNLGILGVLLGTFTSNICTNFWYEPHVIYINKFNVSTKSYFIKFFKYLFVVLLSGLVAFKLCNIVFSTIKILNFIINIIICMIVINCIFFIFFHRSKEFKYLQNIIKRVNKK